MMTLLLESEIAVAVALSLMSLVLLFRWAYRRDRASARALFVSLGATFLGPLVSVLVVTQREEVILMCHRLASAVDQGDVRAIETSLDDSFEASGLNRGEFVERLEAALTRYRVDQPRLRAFDVKVDDAAATAEFIASAQVRFAEGAWDRLPTKWRVRFRRAGSQWLVASMESIPVPPLHMKMTGEWLR